MVVMPVSSATPGCCASHARMRRILGLLSIVFSQYGFFQRRFGPQHEARWGREVLLGEAQQARELLS